MRRVTRNLVIGLLVGLGVLLALGFLPGLLKSGDPYYVTASPVGSVTNETANSSGGSAVDAAQNGTRNDSLVNGNDLPGRRFPYTTDALARASPDLSGASDPYWKGPLGLKEVFTHSPFDEHAALQQRNPNASAGPSTVRVRLNRTIYRVALTQEKPDR